MSDVHAETTTDADERALIGQRLQASRKYLGFTQEEVASHLNIPRSALSDLEKGNRKVEAVELKKFAKLYKQPVGHFTGDDVTTSDLPADIAHLAREAAGLSGNDRAELARFADLLKSRSRIGEG